MNEEHSHRRPSFPLSSMQQGMLFHALAAPRAGYNVEQVIGTLAEPLDVPVFLRAWQRLVDRHEALRMRCFFDDKGNARQQPVARVEFTVDQQDWSALSQGEGEERLAAFLRDDRVRGFDPRADDPIRVTLFKLPDSRCQFVWTWWHGVLDGRARVILLRELFTFYEAFRRGEDIALPLPRPFTDYATWVTGRDHSAAVPYWKELLGDFTEATPVGFDRPATPAARDRGDFGEHEVRLEQNLTSRLRGFADANGVTMNVLVQAAWALVLGQYSGQDDLVFGTTRACRHSAFDGDGSAEGIVGELINTVPVRVRIEPGRRVADWLGDLRAQHLAVRPYEHTPLDVVHACSAVAPDRRLFDSIVIYENELLDSVLRSQGGAWEARRFEIRGRTGFPLTLYAYGEPRLLLQLPNDRAHVDDATASAILAHVVVALQSLASDRDRPVRDVSLLTEEERRRMREWNDTRADYPRQKTLPQLFEEQAARTPGAVAVAHDGASLTYADLDERANQLASHLRAAGAGRGHLVGIFVERSLDMVVGLLGILKAGAAYVPLDPGFPGERLAFIADDAGLRLVVTTESLRDLVPGKDSQPVCLDTIRGQAVAPGDGPRATADDTAYVIYTSGSTGKPKGVEICHGALTNFLWSMRNTPGCTGRDVVLAVTTLSFDIAGLEIYLPLITGARLELASRQVVADGRLLREQIDRCRPTLMQATPATWRMLMDAGWQGSPGLTALCGGEALPPDLAAQLVARTAGLWNMYGPTETTIWSSVDRVSAGEGEITIGRPIANTQFYILDNHLHPVPVGVAGELAIGGDGLAKGYWRRPELTAERFVTLQEPDAAGARAYRTGDLARYRDDGRVVHLGRLDYQVKLRGFRIELGEIEAVLGQHPRVQDKVVVARDGDRPAADKQLVAYIVPRPGDPPTVTDLRRFLLAQLPDYMVPTAFVLIDALPLTPNLKVDRRALPAPDQLRPRLESAYVAPRTEAEAALARIWCEVLGRERVGVEDNFFELGGHSLLATQLSARIERTFDVAMPLRVLFETPTVSGLAVAIAQKQSEEVDDATLERVLAELEGLSPEEAQRLLAAEDDHGDR